MDLESSIKDFVKKHPKTMRFARNITAYGMLTSAAIRSALGQDFTVYGKLLNTQGQPINNGTIKIFAHDANNSPKMQLATSLADGSYAKPFTGIKTINNTVPDKVSVSKSFPSIIHNEEETNTNISTPNAAIIHQTLYNILGQKVQEIYNGTISPSTVKISTQIRGLPTGMYFIKTDVETKNSIETTTNKILVMNGKNSISIYSQGFTGTLTTTAPSRENNTENTRNKLSIESITGTATLDSAVAVADNYAQQTKRLNQTINGNTITIDDFILENGITLQGTIISTIRYNQPNNTITDAAITINGETTKPDQQGKYKINIKPSTIPQKVDINGTNIWPYRDTLTTNDNRTKNFNVLTEQDMPDKVMNYLNYISGRGSPNMGAVLSRFKVPPNFYIVADATTQFGKDFSRILKTFIRGTLNDVTKSILYPQGFLNTSTIEIGLNPPAAGTQGYYVVSTSNQYGNAAALTNDYGDLAENPPYTTYAETIFGTYPQPDTTQIFRLKGHELASGLVYLPSRSDSLVSWYNFGPPIESINPSKSDTLMLRAIFSRNTGWDEYDMDWSRSPKNPFPKP